jgi:uncharacterized protein (DUF427 family)
MDGESSGSGWGLVIKLWNCCAATFAEPERSAHQQRRGRPGFAMIVTSDPKTPMQASWNGQVIAESGDIVKVEGNAYFPPESLSGDCFRPSSHRTVCGWKGEAHYYDVVVDGQVNANAAWFYPDPKAAAEEIRGRVAFWKGVTVSNG